MFLTIFLAILCSSPEQTASIKCRHCISFDIHSAKSKLHASLEPWLNTIPNPLRYGQKCHNTSFIKKQISNCRKGVCQTVVINQTDTRYEWSTCLPRSRGLIGATCTLVDVAPDPYPAHVNICTCVDQLCNAPPIFVENFEKIRAAKKWQKQKLVEIGEMAVDVDQHNGENPKNSMTQSGSSFVRQNHRCCSYYSVIYGTISLYIFYIICCHLQNSQP